MCPGVLVRYRACDSPSWNLREGKKITKIVFAARECLVPFPHTLRDRRAEPCKRHHRQHWLEGVWGAQPPAADPSECLTNSEPKYDKPPLGRCQAGVCHRRCPERWCATLLTDAFLVRRNAAGSHARSDGEACCPSRVTCRPGPPEPPGVLRASQGEP